LGLLSGGLDSILACLVLRAAGVEVEAVSFSSPFFSAQRAREAAVAHAIPLTVLEVGPEHLERVVKNPRYGYGSNMNPCIDCHAYMLKKAGEMMPGLDMDFLFTGEVLGQRPMSQNKQALVTVAKASGVGALVLRPLSAQVLPATQMEESGLVDRARLLGFSGRTRKPQMELATRLGVTDYPAPAGGCLLTEPGFSRRLKDLLDNDPGAGVEMAQLLKHGRHLRLSPAVKLVIGRNQAENAVLEGLVPAGGLRMVALGVPGPLGIYLGPPSEPELSLAASMVAGYGQSPAGQPARVQAGPEREISVAPASRRQCQGYLL
jgi:tRNA U34 2-thiouridine synthase MnmA/TrmU